MWIVPVGRKRLMMAQMMNPDPVASGQGEIDTGLDPEQAQQFGQETALDDRPVNELEDDLHEAENPEASLTKNIIEFLVQLGYPLRRLRDFKSQFYSEKGGNDGGAQVTITLPNQLYDDPDSVLPGRAVKAFVQKLQEDHGLHYEGYDKSDEKLILKLSRIGVNDRMQQMQDGFGDVLDRVYGNPDKGSKDPSKIRAATIREMIKSGKERVTVKLLKALGDSNVASTNR